MSKRPSKTDRHASVTESGDGDAFLSRWAQRKRVARAGEDPDAQEPERSLDGEMLAKAAPTVGEAPLEGDDRQPVELTDEDMPTVDAIDENTDMSGFFSPKVTEAVKKAALRKFFHSPAFNIVDGLDDYDDDFRNFAALGDIITADMRSQMEREAERARESLAKDGPAADESRDPRADESRDGRGRAKQDARADESRDGRGRAKQDARAETPPSQEPPAAHADETDEPLEMADESRDGRGRAKHDSRDAGGRAMPGAIAEDARADEDSAPRQSGAGESDEPGVTRDPGRHAKAGPGKLRPKGAADSDA